MPNTRSLKLLATACTAALVLSAGAAQALEKGSVLKCTFGAGEVKTLENGKFTKEAASKLTFSIGRIDLASQSAQLIAADGNNGLVRIVRAIGAYHFLEAVNEGFLSMTTVYEATKPGAPMVAVHSRHSAVVGQPVIAQYTGHCVPAKP